MNAPRRFALRTIALTLVAALLWLGASGCSRSDRAAEKVRTRSAADGAPGKLIAGRRYADELAQVDATIAGLSARVEKQENAPSACEQAAAMHLQRARLTGDYADYAAAESLIARAFAISPPGAGPFLTRAQLNFTMHRMALVEADLQAEERSLMIDDATRSSITALRANV